MQAEEEALYNSQLIELRKQNAELNLQKATIPEVIEYSDKTLAAIQNQISINEKLKYEIEEKHRKYDLYQSRIKKQEDMDAAAEDLQYQEFQINSELSALKKPTRAYVKSSIRNDIENKVRKEQSQQALETEKENQKNILEKEEAESELNFMKSPEYKQQEEEIARNNIAA